MRTLLMLVLLSMCQLSTAYANTKPKIKFVQDSTGTWRKLEVLKDTPIEQPSGLAFSKEQLQHMHQGGLTSLLDNMQQSWIRFTPRSFPFFYREYTMKRDHYRMTGDKIEFQGKANIRFVYWELSALLIMSVFFTALVLALLPVYHRSIESLVATGAAILVGIEAAHYLGVPGVLLGTVLSIAASFWNKVGDTFDPTPALDPDKGTDMSGVIMGAFRGVLLCLLPVIVGHDEPEAQMTFTVVLMNAVIFAWGILVLRKHRKDRNVERTLWPSTI